MNQGSVDAGVYNALVSGAGTALAAYAGGTANPRVYYRQAPAGAALPYVRYEAWAGGDDNDSPLRSFNVVYLVTAVAETGAAADTGAALIDNALHARTLTITGATNFYTAREAWFDQLDNIEGRQFWRRGGFYRVRGSNG